MNPKNPQAAGEGLRERLHALLAEMTGSRDIIGYGGRSLVSSIVDVVGPAIAPGGDDPALLVCRRLKSPLLTFIRKHVRFTRAPGTASEPEGDDDFAALQLERALLKADYSIPAAANAGAVDDAMCAWCGYAQSTNPLSHDPHCRVRTHPHEKAAALAPAAQQEGAGSGPPPVFYIQADGTHGEYPTPHVVTPADPPAAGDDELDAALFSQAVDEYGEDMAMLIDFMGMGTPEKLGKARRVMRAALLAAQEAARG